jgi:lipopolysaccharide/colanic/teichoic acid biosynthesis glycosyltransferase
MMTSVSRVPVTASYAQVQRVLDVTLGALLLVLSAPLLLVLALAVWLDSPGPVLYRQTRVGLHGNTFPMLKLRTMFEGASEASHRRHIRQLMAAQSPWSPLEHDPRITRVGRLLRRTGLDELPQLWNVVRGEMSLVGPRPALPYETALWQSWHFERLAVRPGITGLWQVNGRGTADFDDMVRMDLEYVERQCLALDLAILARTPLAAVRGRTAPRAAHGREAS